MSTETHYATSLIDIQSEQEAAFYMDKLQVSFPKKKVDLTIFDQERGFGRETVQGLETMGHPAHLLLPENDLSVRNRIDERLSVAAVPVKAMAGPSPQAVWALPGGSLDHAVW